MPLARSTLLGLALLLLGGLPSLPARAGAEPAPRVRKQLPARRLAPGARSKIDGRLDEAHWQAATFVDDFLQKEPEEGAPPSDRTEVALLYDDQALYIGARLHASDPAATRALLTRRDDTSGAERFIVSLDTFLNRRTAYSFAVTAAGVRADWIHTEDSEWARDASYDPVWEADAVLTDWGWSCEMRIPFSQLRFNQNGGGEALTFGVNFNRYLPNTNEDVFWIPVPKKAKGWSSYFGDLTGLAEVKTPRHIELLPYLAADLRHLTPAARDPLDPFGQANLPGGRLGLDAKIGLGPDLTLDATVLPDFGQVEADPAEVNLSDFETFFSEKRPFFVEGNGLLSGNGPQYFYSRRIGAPPSVYPDADYVDLPRASRILGAAKVTGRTEGGLSGGLLLASTAREHADTHDLATGQGGREAVEPFTGFGVLRLQQQVGEDDSTVGVSLTGLQRALRPGEALAEQLPDRAFTGGGDFSLRLGGGDYELSGHAGGSHVHGSEAAIRDLQRSSARYYQRPDQGHVSVDPGRRSLEGYALASSLEKVEGEHWLWSADLAATSPGFELNDLGFLSRADEVRASAWVQRRDLEPGGPVHRWNLNAWSMARWNYGGVLTGAQGEIFGSLTLKSYWGANFFVSGWLPAQDDRATRGGPLLRTSEGFSAGGGVYSPGTRKQTANLFVHTGATAEGGRWFGSDLSLSAQLGSRVRLSFTPRFNRSYVTWQYVDTLDGGPGGALDTYGRRYFFARGLRSTLAFPLRLQIGLTPDLHLELYAELYTTSGRYDDYGRLLDGHTGEVRWSGGEQLAREDGYVGLEDEGERVWLSDYDFHYSSLRSNLVLRWEFLPGSTLYLVWQQDRSWSDALPRPLLQGVAEGFTGAGQHVLAMKLAYWFAP
ncbi:MAG: DUF5916 domain-containing protein [Deltaproteobacteria bacterium]|nr:DUF5916 domain-containing protein [Deltaproteobacteria bacterium]